MTFSPLRLCERLIHLPDRQSSPLTSFTKIYGTSQPTPSGTTIHGGMSRSPLFFASHSAATSSHT
ncbi:hypothetical protein Micbo1qcDRAFT_165850, partial [Microdochium bolleyi]